MKNCNVNFKLKVLDILIKELDPTAKKNKMINENRKKALIDILPTEGEECIYDLIIY